MKEIIAAEDREHLENLIKEHIDKYWNNCSLNHIDISYVMDLSKLFFNFPKFNWDISKWNITNVKDMSFMFMFSDFNWDISKWNVSWVVDTSFMFYGSKFNWNLKKWNISNITNMSYMFANSEFEWDISKWKLHPLWNYDGFLWVKTKLKPKNIPYLEWVSSINYFK